MKNTLLTILFTALVAPGVSSAQVILSRWTFDAGATQNERLVSSNTVSGLTVSQLNFHPTFDVGPFLTNNPTDLINFSTHDRWAPDPPIGSIRMRSAAYTQAGAPSGRSATFDSTNSSISSSAETVGAPIWFSVSTDSLTTAAINAIEISNPGASNALTYFFSKSGDPLGAGVSDEQATVPLPAPIVVRANQTVFFSINMRRTGFNTNHNISNINLKGTTAAVYPMSTSTLTVGAPHGTYNRLSVTVDPAGIIPASSDTTDLNGTVKITVSIDPLTGKTPLLTLSNGSVTATDMDFTTFAYDIDARGLSAEVKTKTPPGTVDPNTGVFAANQHEFIINRGTFSGTAAGQPFSESLQENPFTGLGTGNGSLTLTPAGTSGPYNLFNAVVTLPVLINESITASGITTTIVGSGTVKATGQIQMPSSAFNAWMILQGATSFDPMVDTGNKGAPDGIKWALGLSSRFADPLTFLLKPHPSIPRTFVMSLPPEGTLAPLTLESANALLPVVWTPLPAGQMTPSVNPIPAGSTGVIGIAPTATGKFFLRLRADP